MPPDRPHIAILGATSHLAKSMIVRFARHDRYRLELYARQPEQVKSFLDSEFSSCTPECTISSNFEDVAELDCHAVINCVGVGTHRKLGGDFSRYFTVTEQFDNLSLRFLKSHPEATYISFSSGAVYGRSLPAPAAEDSEARFIVNHIAPQDYYAVARLNAEAKHRSLSHLNIVDLRLFSYFSRYIDCSDGYFITDVMNSIREGTVLETGADNIIRDYVHSDDLFSLLLGCLETPGLNAALDVASAEPVTKQEILEHFAAEYGLRYEVNNTEVHHGPTGAKNIYCSNYRNAETILGHRPLHTSMETIRQEAAVLLGAS